VTGIQYRRRKHLQDELKGMRSYSAMKEEILQRTVWRTGFRRGYGPVVRETLE
jgi:hypothetical protein